MGITLWSLKRMSRLEIIIKAIKYKEDFFYYLSSYSDLGLQATCFQILSFRPHAFRSFFWTAYFQNSRQNIFAQVLDPRSILTI